MLKFVKLEDLLERDRYDKEISKDQYKRMVLEAHEKSLICLDNNPGVVSYYQSILNRLKVYEDMKLEVRFFWNFKKNSVSYYVVN